MHERLTEGRFELLQKELADGDCEEELEVEVVEEELE